jgi:hypothetical protein
VPVAEIRTLDTWGETWKKYVPKIPAEVCVVLDAGQVFAHDQPPPPARGVLRWLRWNYEASKEVEADEPSQAFTLKEVRDGVLALTLELWGGAGEQVVEIRRGRLQTFFVCGCGRVVRKLYRPPGETALSCRQCWNLTYLSCLRRQPLEFLPRSVAVTPRFE